MRATTAPAYISYPLPGSPPGVCANRPRSAYRRIQSSIFVVRRGWFFVFHFFSLLPALLFHRTTFFSLPPPLQPQTLPTSRSSGIYSYYCINIYIIVMCATLPIGAIIIVNIYSPKCAHPKSFRLLYNIYIYTHKYFVYVFTHTRNVYIYITSFCARFTI